MNEKWKQKMQSLQKMCQDLSTVMRRYITDVQKEKEQVAPIKITRSVGLQASMLFKGCRLFFLQLGWYETDALKPT